MAPVPSLRVLCFGDSLTSGFSNLGASSHPYSQQLAARLKEAFPDLEKIHVVPNGVPGDRVMSAGFQSRLEKAVERGIYDWVLILGGTNDIGSRALAEDAASALYEIWNTAMAQDCKVLAMTVPECATKISWLDSNRDMLNHMILTHEDTNYHTFDLKSKIPFHSLTDEDKVKYWDDGLHLTNEGYDWMGDQIADALIPLVKQDRRISLKKSIITPVIPPRVWGDDIPLEEEIGDPRDINSGYVVVRKKDLD